jgi:5-formyltetrahydrofolate cyclo-ligase
MPDDDRAPDAGADRKALRRRLIAERRAMPDRSSRAARLEAVLGAWLGQRSDTTIGAYWAIRGEFDALPVLSRWMAAASGRQVGLPVIDPATQRLRFRAWWPGCPMRDDAFGIPVPDGTDTLDPTLLLVPCVGFGPGGVRLGYGGGFYDRTLAGGGSRPATAGIAFAHAFVPRLVAQPHDIPLDVVLTEEGVVWDRGA